MELYEKYFHSKTGTTENKTFFINDLIETYPEIIDYLFNRIETCFGEHTVYLVKIKVNDINILKIGYTKNSVEARFAEKRYIDGNSLEIIEIIRSNKLQAKGAVEFEEKVKTLCNNYIIDSHLSLPGKNEFMDIIYLDDITKIYDAEFDNYKDIIGLKPPN